MNVRVCIRLCNLIWASISDLSESDRVDVKKFQESKAPLTGLKFKMQLKASKNEAFKVWSDELDNIILEQNKFLENVEYNVAVAEAIDPVQA